MSTSFGENHVQLDPLVAILGLAAGLSIGLTGVGAGSVLTPFLVTVLRMHPAGAVGSALLFTLVTRGAGSVQHLRQGTADLRTVAWLAAASVPSALLSLAVLAHLPFGAPQTDALRERLIAAALFLAAGVLTWRFVGGRSGHRLGSRWPLLALGTLLGVTVATTSVGTGSVGLAGLALLTPLGAATLVGTDTLHGAILAAVTAPVYLAQGSVDLASTANLLIGSIPGVLVGSRLAARMPERVTRLTVLLAVWSLAFKLA
ncbi:MAG TPA: sulfite exporter TauE/SafE family protein [Candidatus Dormibacteraeota bacterium]|nr:sulfite exporter TauE/SafE family protein [Candidatus Dormibacteraeota bacterium]